MPIQYMSATIALVARLGDSRLQDRGPPANALVATRDSISVERPASTALLDGTFLAPGERPFLPALTVRRERILELEPVPALDVQRASMLPMASTAALPAPLATSVRVGPVDPATPALSAPIRTPTRLALAKAAPLVPIKAALPRPVALPAL